MLSALDWLSTKDRIWPAPDKEDQLKITVIGLGHLGTVAAGGWLPPIMTLPG